MILSELAQSHLGDMKILRMMVKESAEAGAWGCKIQSFFANDLASNWKHDQVRLKGLELDWVQHKEFVKMCEDQGLVPVTSVYADKYLDKVYKAGFKIVKIGSAQNRDSDLVSSYLAAGFEVMVSTGGIDLVDLKNENYHTVFHCVSQYPTNPWHTDLSSILLIKKNFPNAYAGFSSHVDPTHPHWQHPLFASYAFGARMLEVHYTSLQRDRVKDGKVSLNIWQLKELCEFDKCPDESRHEIWPQYGMYRMPKTEEEINLIDHYRGRWNK